ncbi:hypothetical protein [Halosimplex salinum]|uniref:hypothetical protein n=1 Tax=Halosimplex salinum TaxID=1710538 RepID=UPI000F490DA0|nr:hypothetical protein [Halosimplex salinum]
MPGRATDSPLGRVFGAAGAAIAVALLILDRTTDLAVPYGYDGDAFVLGAVVALIAVVAVGWRYRDRLTG